MAEETQNNSQDYVIMHAKDGWTFQQHDTIPEENAIIYKCGGCGQLIKVQSVIFEDPSENAETFEQQDTEQQQQEEQRQAENQAIQQVKQLPKKKGTKRKSKETVSHTG